MLHYPTGLRKNVMPVHYVVHSQVKTFRIPRFALLNGLQRSRSNENNFITGTYSGAWGVAARHLGLPSNIFP